MTLQIEGSPVTRVTWSDATKTEPDMLATEDSNYYVVTTKSGWILESADGGENPDEEIGEFDPGLEAALQKKIDLAGLADETFCCDICQDYQTESEWGSNRSGCGHIYYSNDLSSWCGCGYTEEDHSEAYAESFAKLVEQCTAADYDDMPIADVIQALKDRNLRKVWDFMRWLDGDDTETARCYLKSLDEDVPQASFERAIAWLGGAS